MIEATLFQKVDKLTHLDPKRAVSGPKIDQKWARNVVFNKLLWTIQDAGHPNNMNQQHQGRRFGHSCTSETDSSPSCSSRDSPVMSSTSTPRGGAGRSIQKSSQNRPSRRSMSPKWPQMLLNRAQGASLRFQQISACTEHAQVPSGAPTIGFRPPVPLRFGPHPGHNDGAPHP